MNSSLIRHTLPDSQMQGDIAWFTHRQNTFEQQVIRQQVKYRNTNKDMSGLPDGPFSKQPNHTYPHILPPGNERLAFYSGFADDVMTYMNANDIAIHTEALNLKSSQVACLNFLFPLRRDLALAADVFRKLEVFRDLQSVTGIEFEYTAQDETQRRDQPCTQWLGEPKSGKRGQNRTSIDAAVFWTDRHEETHITLIEWKYTERNFGSCSAFDKAEKPIKARCLALDVKAAPAEHCLLAGSGRNCVRHYWDLMQHAGISLSRLSAIRGCPFRGPFYQLMRQFLVAQYLRDARQAQHIDVVAIDFEGNDALRSVPPDLKPLVSAADSTVVAVWNSILEGVPQLRCITAERLLAAYDTTPTTDPAWRQYITDRYGL